MVFVAMARFWSSKFKKKKKKCKQPINLYHLLFSALNLIKCFLKYRYLCICIISSYPLIRLFCPIKFQCCFREEKKGKCRLWKNVLLKYYLQFGHKKQVQNYSLTYLTEQKSPIQEKIWVFSLTLEISSLSLNEC